MTKLSGRCDRCLNDVAELKKLEFKTIDKRTEICLCKICLNAAREMWKRFMENGKKTR
jgi:hypothetical protein